MSNFHLLILVYKVKITLKMKNKLLISLLFSLTIACYTAGAQSFEYVWGKNPGGSFGQGNSIITDINGNIITTGQFNEGNLSFGTTSLNSKGGVDFFVVKYDPSGNLLWAQSAGGASFDAGMGITSDVNGNIVITGCFNGTITFGKTALTSKGSKDIFVVKYDASGNVLWAKSAGGLDSETGASISSDVHGNVIVTGYFQSSSLMFDTTKITNKSIGNREDIFIVKYDASGKVLWAKGVGGSDPDLGRSIATDASGNIVITGEYSSASLSFDTQTITNTTEHSKEIFVVKYNANGQVIWSKSAGGGTHDVGTGICSDAKGNVLVTGYFFNSTLTFGSITLTNAPGFNSNMFVVKYDKSGNVIWAKTAGENGDEFGTAICTDAGGNVFVSGEFMHNPIIFDAIKLSNAGDRDIFVVKYDASGKILQAKGAGGIAIDENKSMCTDPNGNVFITGVSASDSLKFGSSVLTNKSSIGIYIAKLIPLSTNTISKDLKANSVSVYPNPLADLTTIRFYSGIHNGHLNVYNTYGQLVKEMKNIKGHEIQFSREGIASGMHTLYLTENDKFLFSQKILLLD